MMIKLAALAAAVVAIFATAPVTHRAPAPTFIQVPEVTIVGEVPSIPEVNVEDLPRVTQAAHRVTRPVATKQLRFVCGPMHENDIGGQNADCFYR